MTHFAVLGGRAFRWDGVLRWVGVWDLPTFVASQCIQYLVHLSAFLCIYNTMHFHPLLHYHAFGARDTFMCITVCMHSERDAYKRIQVHAHALHSDAF